MSQFLNQNSRNAIKKVMQDYKAKREQVLAGLGVSQEEYVERMATLRQKAFVDFEEQLERAKDNLAKNGFQIHAARDAAEARAIFKELLKDSERVVKSKTNTGHEIGLEKMGANFDREVGGRDGRIEETDLGDFVVELMKGEDQHYVLPALHINSEEISEKIKAVYGDEVAAEPEKLTHYLSGKIREKILAADTGITGANFFTQSGQVVLLENEGNISLVSRLPRKHIVLVGIDKLVESVEDATELCRTAAIFGTGQPITQYISVISGPSKTADIENRLVMGAQGAREAHLVLLDNGRRKMMTGQFKQMCRCISCGACLNFCSTYYQMGKKFGGKFAGAKGLVMATNLGDVSLAKVKEGKIFDCTLCENCTFNCPMQIPLDSYIREIREQLESDGLQSEKNKEMLANVKKTGNPFGKTDDSEIPDKLYCC